MTQLQLLRLHIDVSIIREQYVDYKITPGGTPDFKRQRLSKASFGLGKLGRN